MSSDLQNVGYDEATCTLEIKFHSGGVYQYSGVPKSLSTHVRLSGSEKKQLQSLHYKNSQF